MIISLRTIYFILEFFIYLLIPFAWLIVKIDKVCSKTEHRIIYYLLTIPYYILLPFSYLWIIIYDCQIDIWEKIKFKKQYRDVNKN